MARLIRYSKMWSFLFLVPSFLHCLFGHSKNNEDLRQQNSELEEKLRILVAEKAAAQLGVEELQKKLEMSELLLQQVIGAAHTPKAPGTQTQHPCKLPVAKHSTV